MRQKARVQQARMNSVGDRQVQKGKCASLQAGRAQTGQVEDGQQVLQAGSKSRGEQGRHR